MKHCYSFGGEHCHSSVCVYEEMCLLVFSINFTRQLICSINEPQPGIGWIFGWFCALLLFLSQLFGLLFANFTVLHRTKILTSIKFRISREKQINTIHRHPWWMKEILFLWNFHFELEREFSVKSIVLIYLQQSKQKTIKWSHSDETRLSLNIINSNCNRQCELIY